MTIFRSNLLRETLLLLASAGLFGFLACGAVNFAAQRRLRDNPALTQPSLERTAEIRIKGMSGWVEQDYATRLRLSDERSLYFWLVSLPGFLGLFMLRKSR